MQQNTSPQHLSPQETELIQMMRSGKYHSAHIKFREGRPISIDLNLIHETNRKVVDILQDDPFQTIIIKTHQGRIVHQESTIKRKFE